MTLQTDENFTALIQSGESFRCEWKSDISSKDNKEKICRTICAFANDISDAGLNGVIAMGVNNEGLPSGLEITDAVESALLNIHAEGKIVPLPSFVVKKQDFMGKPILRIEVTPAVSTPVKYDGRIWIRPGNATLQASHERQLAFDLVYPIHWNQHRFGNFCVYSITDSDGITIEFTEINR